MIAEQIRQQQLQEGKRSPSLCPWEDGLRVSADSHHRLLKSFIELRGFEQLIIPRGR